MPDTDTEQFDELGEGDLGARKAWVKPRIEALLLLETEIALKGGVNGEAPTSLS
jgi:hypothetical protein